MRGILDLFDLATGGQTHAEKEGGLGQLLFRGALATIGLGAAWGLAAGSTEVALAAANVYKVPMVILLSAASAAPVGLVTWKLTGAGGRARDLVLAMSAGNLTAALVLAALAPLVALYYQSSASWGGVLAMGSAGLAVAAGLASLLRAMLLRAPTGLRGVTAMLPMGILAGAQLLALVQFIHVASPILPEVTVFDGGVDAVLGG